MSDRGLAAEIAKTLELVLINLQQVPPLGTSPALVVLFEKLAAASSGLEQAQTEGQIWDAWTQHTDPVLAKRMNDAIAAMAQRDMHRAEALLDTLTVEAPTWAEVWNKRATLRFFTGNTKASLADIRATLQLEPRHFGALAGFGQICLQNSEPESARIAFQAALASNPHLESVARTLTALDREAPRTMH